MPWDLHLFQSLKMNRCWGSYLLDNEGLLLQETNFYPNKRLPMASTVKLLIAYVLLEKMYKDNSFALDTVVQLSNEDFCPGLPSNELDRHFFNSEDISVNKTIDELVTLMLTQSDNTATDKLLSLIGGPTQVNARIKGLELGNYCFTSTMRQLLAEYYQMDMTKTPENIAAVNNMLPHAFEMNPATEKRMADNAKDLCSPLFMINFMRMLVREANSGWDDERAKTACYMLEKMQGCKTGDALMRKGAQQHSQTVEQIGNKTGSLGSILNDVGFVKLKNNNWIVYAFFSCCSKLPLLRRQAIIAYECSEIINFQSCERGLRL